MTFTVMGLGSNRPYEDKTSLKILACACAELSHVLKDLKVSPVYRTAAMYVTDQDDFYNMVVTGWYAGEPMDLLNQIHLVEYKFGRNRSLEIRNGPRSLDVDIEFFGLQCIQKTGSSEGDLFVPHPRIKERAFVLKPLLDILSENAEEYIYNGAQLSGYLSALGDQRIEQVVSETEMQKLVEAQK